ncbi:MAG: hypothetical protein JSS60_04035 [Verrucomicrobia bacterium]|nr:hypothetical protein [Verrucomicrobiota bacterium]
MSRKLMLALFCTTCSACALFACGDCGGGKDENSTEIRKPTLLASADEDEVRIQPFPYPITTTDA